VARVAGEVERVAEKVRAVVVTLAEAEMAPCHTWPGM
jgi:hypothetical protein